MTVAAVNGPTQVVIAGTRAGVAAVRAAVEGAGGQTRSLEVSHAFHSPLMEGMTGAFGAVTAGVRYGRPQVPVVSNVTGRPHGAETAWGRIGWSTCGSRCGLRRGWSGCGGRGTRCSWRWGPQATLAGLGRQCVGGRGCGWRVCGRGGSGGSCWRAWGRCMSGGRGSGGRRWRGAGGAAGGGAAVSAARQRYWVSGARRRGRAADGVAQWVAEGRAAEVEAAVTAELAGTGAAADPAAVAAVVRGVVAAARREQRAAAGEWLGEVQWERAAAPAAGAEGGRWLVVAERGGVGEAVAQGLTGAGAAVTRVYPEPGPTRRVADGWAVAPDGGAAAWEAVWGAAGPVTGVVHLGSLGAAATAELTVAGLARAQELGCESVRGCCRRWWRRGAGAAVGGDPGRGGGGGSGLTGLAQGPVWGWGK